MAAADTVLHIAEAEDGYHESGVNRTKFGRAFGWDGVAWCAIFVWWCFWRAGLLALLPTKTASAPGLAEAFQRAGRWGHTPRKGAVVFFDLNGNGGIDHVGIVIAKLADGRIKTVEGNTVDGVHIRYRSPSLVKGYGYPDYTQEDDMQLKDVVNSRGWTVGECLQAAKQQTDELEPLVKAQAAKFDALAAKLDALTKTVADLAAKIK